MSYVLDSDVIDLDEKHIATGNETMTTGNETIANEETKINHKITTEINPKITTEISAQISAQIIPDTQQDQAFLSNLSTNIMQICSRFNRFQIAAHTVENVKTGKQLIGYHNMLLATIKTQIKSLETVLQDSTELLQEMTDDLIQETRQDDFVFMTALGMLSYNGRSITKEKRNIPASIRTNYTNGSACSATCLANRMPNPIVSMKTFIPQVKYNMNLPHIKRLEDAKSMFYWYENNIYVKLSNDICVKVPFPDIYDSAKNYERRCSMRCKYKTKEICDRQRSEVARLYSSPIRTCNFAHIGDKLVKIGYPSRCPSRPNYGNPATIAEDSKIITIDDIKSMLLYGLNDLIIATIWLDYKKEKITFDDLVAA